MMTFRRRGIAFSLVHNGVLPVVFLFAALGMFAPAAAEVEILKDGKSAHRIVLDQTASASEKHAAEELQSCFEASTGVKLPIVVGMPSEAGPMIVIGRGKVAASLGVEPTDAQLGEQGCVVRTVEPHLVIAGTARAGTLRGVRYFVENVLSVRWYAPDATKTPRHTNLVIAKTDRVIQPGFAWRQTSYAWPGGDAEFHGRRGCNSGGAGKDDPLGEQYAFDGTCHTYFNYISPEEFFDKHPEYFAEINGRRVREETQLCLTNSEVLEIVTERMLQRMKDHPHYRQHNFSQMDWYNYCECPKCRAMNEKYGAAGGTQFWFVNELAKRTSKQFPDKLVGTLAYMYTEEPPRGVTMHPNVAVWLCHMFPCCDSHPIESCPLNADYLRRARAWSKVCPHLYVWHYIVDFAHYYNPFPNFRAIAADMRLYKSLGVEGIYAQAMSHGGGGGEFSLLRGYYVSELLKDPGQDAEPVLRDFLDGYYGAAAEPIWRYVKLLHDKVQNQNIHMHLYTNPAQGYLTDDVMTAAGALFDEAEAAVKDDATLLERVRVARMPLVYANTFPRNGYKIDDGKLVFQGPLATADDARGFLARMKRHGFQTIRERGGDPQQLMLLTTVLRTPMPLVTLRNKHVQVDVAPFLGGRALRIVDRKTGRSVTAYNTTRNLLFPFCGGEESRVGGIFTIEEGGSMDPAMVVQSSETSVTLASKTGVGFLMKRTLTLDPDRPVLKVRLEVTNPSKKPREAQLRSHLSLDLGDVHKTRVGFTDLSGKTIDKDMAVVIQGLREGERFYREACPSGKWTFTGPNGLAVTQRFDNRQVDFTWLVAYPEDLNELEVELWAKKVVLAPGASATLEHELEL
jgi:hypothetical protein